jgi:hypothetical protein
MPKNMQREMFKLKTAEQGNAFKLTEVNAQKKLLSRGMLENMLRSMLR